MYEDTESRTQEFATWIGIHKRIVRIFTSRIPKKVVKTAANGKKYEIDGDTIIYTTLNDLYHLQGTLAASPAKKEEILNKYTALVEKLKNNPKANIEVPCFERFTVKECLAAYMPRAKKVTIEELTQAEVTALYEWIAL